MRTGVRVFETFEMHVRMMIRIGSITIISKKGIPGPFVPKTGTF